MMIKRIALATPILLAGIIYGSQAAMACGCCGSYEVVNVASWDVLNIRTGPSVRYRKVGAIPPHTPCVIKTGRKRGRWHQISYAETTGWVNSRYLRFINYR